MTDALLRLGEGDLKALSAAFRSGRLLPPCSAISLGRILPSVAAEALAKDFQSLTAEGFNGGQLARLCEALALQQHNHGVADDVLDIVTTGPGTESVTNRDTSVVVRDLFGNAKSSVLLAGYAVHRGQRVFQALVQRMTEDPALKVRFLLDIQRPYGDKTLADVLVKRFASTFAAQNWPAAGRLPEVYYDPRSLEIDAEKRASLHAKCVIVDDSVAFVSSANFTEAAQNKNIEVGLLIKSHVVACKLAGHFKALIDRGLVKRAF